MGSAETMGEDRWPALQAPLRTIVVPLDGTALGERALPAALNVARRTGARLELVHVHTARRENPMPEVRTLEEVKRLKERRYLLGLASAVSSRHGTPVQASLLEGAVVPAILEYATGCRADLIVLATHARAGLSRSVLGSVADELVRRSGMPVLTVGPRSLSPHVLGEGTWDTVAVPLDGSALAEQVLGSVARISPQTLLLVQVLSPVDHVGLAGRTYVLETARGLEATRTRAAERYLQTVARSMQGLIPRVSTRVVVAEDVPAAIVEQAKSGEADLIALSTHGRSGLSRLVLGSVADRLVRVSPLPVLKLRPQGQSVADVEKKHAAAT